MLAFVLTADPDLQLAVAGSAVVGRLRRIWPRGWHGGFDRDAWLRIGGSDRDFPVVGLPLHGAADAAKDAMRQAWAAALRALAAERPTAAA